MGTLNITEAAKVELKDASKYVLWDSNGTVFTSNFQVNPHELKPITNTLGDRDEAIKNGIVLNGTRYEVHRYHPPLVYGRTMQSTPETSEGIALCKIETGPTGGPAYGLITYQMPNISARMVPILQRFCTEQLATSS